MTAERLGSYASPMNSGSLDEQAALIALLQARPGRLSWSEITAEVLVCRAGNLSDISCQ